MNASISIVARDGTPVPYSSTRVRKSILLAIHATGARGGAWVDDAVAEVTRALCSRENVTVATVSSTVETVLSRYDTDVWLAYTTYRTQRDAARAVRTSPDPTHMSDYIHAAKYARDGESWTGTVDRLFDMHERHLDAVHLDVPLADLWQAVLDRRVLPSMRSLQFGGRAIEANHMRMYNCTYVNITNGDTFGKIMWLLLCGCGVGYSVRAHHVDRLPPVLPMQGAVEHHVISDTIEGWADAVCALMHAAFVTGRYVEFSYHLIRPSGARLVTSGGTAPGHTDLKVALDNCRLLLAAAAGRRLRPIEVNDIVCTLAWAVRAGGIRRSSCICLFDAWDGEMAAAKSAGVWSPTGAHAQRAMANNSICISTLDGYNAYGRAFDTSISYGEPGVLFLATGEADCGINPCGEIGLRSPGVCNLVEVNLSAVRNEREMLDACHLAGVLATIQASYNDFSYVSNTIAREDSLIGVSLLGMCAAPSLGFNYELQKRGAATVRAANRVTAEALGLPPAARCTCIKPGGTVSLLCGTTAGISPAYARRYLRRVAAAGGEPWAAAFRATNPMACDDQGITFPVEAGANTLLLEDSPALTQLDRIVRTKRSWVDCGHRRGPSNNVSCTVYYTNDEVTPLKHAIWANRKHLRALAYAPCGIENQYANAPLQAVRDASTEHLYSLLSANMRRVNYSMLTGSGAQDTVACEGDSCLI